MLYILMIIAAATALLTTVICIKLKWNNVYAVAALQFAASFVVTISVANYAERAGYGGDFLVRTLIVAAVIPVTFIIMRVLVGPLANRKKGLADKNLHPTKYKEHPSS